VGGCRNHELEVTYLCAGTYECELAQAILSSLIPQKSGAAEAPRRCWSPRRGRFVAVGVHGSGVEREERVLHVDRPSKEEHARRRFGNPFQIGTFQLGLLGVIPVVNRRTYSPPAELDPLVLMRWPSLRKAGPPPPGFDPGSGARNPDIELARDSSRHEKVSDLEVKVGARRRLHLNCDPRPGSPALARQRVAREENHEPLIRLDRDAETPSPSNQANRRSSPAGLPSSP